MKIGVICRGRTGSSAVTRTIAKKHQCLTIGENFQAHSHILGKKDIECSEKMNIFKKYIFQSNKNLFFQKRFVVKIWPSMLILPPNKIENFETFVDFRQKIIFDIEEHLFLSKYDHLYFLDRNLYDSTLSWVYAKKINVFHKTKTLLPNYYKIKLDDNDYALAKFYILEYCLQKKIKKYLQNSNIAFTEITMDDFDFDSNLPLEKSENDYKNLIIGVDDMIKFIGEQYNICQESTKDWVFS